VGREKKAEAKKELAAAQELEDKKLKEARDFEEKKLKETLAFESKKLQEAQAREDRKEARDIKRLELIQENATLEIRKLELLKTNTKTDEVKDGKGDDKDGKHFITMKLVGLKGGSEPEEMDLNLVQRQTI
jgi:hypothetical protein